MRVRRPGEHGFQDAGEIMMIQGGYRPPIS